MSLVLECMSPGLFSFNVGKVAKARVLKGMVYRHV